MIEFWLLKEECTGCEACTNICSQNAITMKLDVEHGFKYPHIDNEKCIECGMCKKQCPIYYEKTECTMFPFVFDDRKKMSAYAAWSRDDYLRLKSTSGGVFSELAQSILGENGVVYGAYYDTNMIVKHKNVSDMRELSCLRRSKYVQSEINYSYRKAKKDLESNKKVLFVGSPCQIAGLFSYLRKKYSNLYTVEFICLGVNSPLVYRKWINEIEENYKKVVKDIWFKYKTEGWRESPMHTLIEFEDGSTILLDDKSNYYMKGYLNGGYYVRKSCSNCKFMKDKRYADIVIGDYWDVDKSIDDGKGTSIVLTLSSNGEELFNKLKCRLNYYPVEVESISAGNPRFIEPAPYNPKSEDFFRELKTSRFSDLMKKFTAEENSEPEIMSRIKKGKDN